MGDPTSRPFFARFCPKKTWRSASACDHALHTCGIESTIAASRLHETNPADQPVSPLRTDYTLSQKLRYTKYEFCVMLVRVIASIIWAGNAMTDFLDKLNLLLRSSLKSLASGERPTHPPTIAPDKLGKDIDREINALRKQINAAISHQEALQSRMDDMARQISDYDMQVDAALRAGDDQRAHYLLTQKQRLEQRLRTQAETLERHRAATSELIEQVSQLETMVAEAQTQPSPTATSPQTSQPASNAASAQSTPAAPQIKTSIPIKVDRASETLDPIPESLSERPEVKRAEQSVTTAEQRVTVLSDVLRAVRERVEETFAPLTKPREEKSPAATTPQTTQPPTAAPTPSKPAASDDDLAQRRKRLSLPE